MGRADLIGNGPLHKYPTCLPSTDTGTVSAQGKTGKPAGRPAVKGGKKR